MIPIAAILELQIEDINQTILHRYGSCVNLSKKYKGKNIVDKYKFDDYWFQHYTSKTKAGLSEPIISKINLLNIRLCNFCSYLYGGNKKY